MTRPFHELAELRSLLDALCEESITPEQVRRLEELVLTHPEAEAHYVQFMSLHADLVGHFGVLPGPTEQSLRDRAGTAPQEAAAVTLPVLPRRGMFIQGALVLAGVAAGLLLALALGLRPRASDPEPDPTAERTDNTVAVLLRAPGADWGDTELPTRPGAP